MENEVHSYSLDHTKIIENIPLPYCLLVDTLNVFSEKLPNIYVQLEPNAIYNNEDYLLENQGKYHTILTFNQRILDSCPNARKYIYGTTWMEKYMYDNVDISKKQFAISHMSGTKVWPNAPGHILRQIIHNNQEILTSYPITFYRSFHPPQLHDYGNNPILSPDHKDKVILFETYQFAIVIENSKQTNYFTEKLMDCLLMKTIPIYYGCPNISDFFDTTGWIIINTIQGENILYELDSKLYLLCQDKHYYNNHFNIIEKNHVIAQKYTDIYINLSNSI
jgi:hypothetical protein